MEKAEVRDLALKKRNALTEADRREMSIKIAEQLESQAIFKDAQSILFYYSVQSEVSTLDLLSRWAERKFLFLPRLVEGFTFLPLPFSSIDELEPNKFGIPEPTIMADTEESPKLDLIIVPGVAFDRAGNRIGMGKGYYDRFLKQYDSVPKMALAYSEQVLDVLPKEPYDKPINWIVTESEVIQCKG